MRRLYSRERAPKYRFVIMKRVIGYRILWSTRIYVYIISIYQYRERQTYSRISGHRSRVCFTYWFPVDHVTFINFYRRFFFFNVENAFALEPGYDCVDCLNLLRQFARPCQCFNFMSKQRKFVDYVKRSIFYQMKPCKCPGCMKGYEKNMLVDVCAINWSLFQGRTWMSLTHETCNSGCLKRKRGSA